MSIFPIRLTVLTIAVLLFCPGLLSTGKAEPVMTYEMPIPSQFKPAIQADGTPLYITAPQIEKDIRQYSKQLIALHWNKKIKGFIVPRHSWLDDLLDFYSDFLEWGKIQGEADTWDCENFSSLLNALATIRIWEAGYYDTRGAIGWMLVDAKEEWAGLPGVMHALMFAVTEDGFYVIEPQNGTTIELADYPNNMYIQEVFLF